MSRDPKCPKCRASLGRKRKGVRRCSGCRGLWVEWGPDFADVQPRVVSALAGIDASRGGGSDWSCVDCDGKLRAIVRNGVELDICDRCNAIFFDRYELERLDEGLPGGAPEERAHDMGRTLAHELLMSFLPFP